MVQGAGVTSPLGIAPACVYGSSGIPWQRGFGMAAGDADISVADGGADGAASVAVLVPCHDEAPTVARVVRDFKAALPQATVYVYDNASSDGTAAEAFDAGAVVGHEAARGKGNVVRRMFADVDADVYLLVDGDDTYDAASAPKLVEQVRAGHDLVNGVRIASSDEAFRAGHRFGNSMLTWLVNVMFGQCSLDMLTGYRAMSRRFVKSFPALSSGFEIETELTVHALELRMPVADVATPYRERPEGSESKIRTLRDGTRILFTILRLLERERPRGFFASIAALFGLASVVLAWPLLATYLATGQVPRLPTAVLASALAVLAFAALGCGVLLSAVTRARHENKRLHYLLHSGPPPVGRRMRPLAASPRPQTANPFGSGPFAPLRALFSDSRMVVCAICLALMVPLLFSLDLGGRNFLGGWPRTYSGDEVHYLVAINSVIGDGDLDLANNYRSVHDGSEQAGYWSRHRPLDHHTAWVENGARRIWWDVFELDPAKWGRDAAGNPVPTPKPGVQPPPPGTAEYPIHPPGLPLVLAPLLFPFAGTTLVEPMAILCSTLAVIGALFFYVALVRKYTRDGLTVGLAAGVTFLGTPAWDYARSLFSEPVQMLCAAGAYSLSLRGRSPLLAGLLIGVGLLVKPPFAILMLPVLAMHLWDRDVARALRFAAPVAVSLAVYLALNAHMFGSPFTVAQPWLPGSFWAGAIGTLFSPRYGYFLVAPALVVALAAFPAFLRLFRRDAIVLAAGVVIHFALYASYGNWSGSTSYGARYVVPLIPLVFVPLAVAPQAGFWRRAAMRRIAVLICVVSVVANAAAAVEYWRYWDSNVWLALLD